MIINDVKLTTPDGVFEFKGVGEREMTMPIPGLPVMNLSSALGTPMGAIFIKPGMVFEYANPTAVTSQIDAATGMVKKSKESDGIIVTE